MSELRNYRVKSGQRFGAGGKYGPGEIVSLDPVHAAAFMDKLEPVLGEATGDAVAETDAGRRPLPDTPQPYRVKAGVRFGAGGRHGPGEVVFLPRLLASRFLDKLEPVAEIDGAAAAKEDDGAVDAGEEMPAAAVVAEVAAEPAVELSEVYDVANARVDVVMEWVTTGQVSAGDALAQEQASRRPRQTLLRALEALLP